jgi:uncharacterized protein YcbK (DUF882 family)
MFPQNPYFKLEEFDQPGTPGTGKNMSPAFIMQLIKCREIARIPFNINSGYRSVEWELKQKRSGFSAHTKGLAADIQAIGTGNRFIIVEAAIKSGFKRIGIAETYVHLDTDPDKPQGVVWLY